MKVGFLQFAPERLEIEKNVTTIVRLLEGARDALIVTPELALSGYMFRNPEEFTRAGMNLRDARLDPLYRRLEENRLHLALGIAEKAPEGAYNSLLLAGPAGPVIVYRKIHLFDREKRFFLPGDAPPPVVEAGGARVGLMVCWDWFFPETARFLARRGAQVIAHATNLVLPWCLDAMRTRSLENRIFSVTANRTGTEEASGIKQDYTGRSQVVDPLGDRILAVGGGEIEGVFTVDLDPALADEKRMTPRNPGPWEVRLDLLGGGETGIGNGE